MRVVAQWDVVVVGAGPAGAAAALGALAARPDARVLLLDKAAFPRDKACGDGIAPHAFDELAAVGLGDLYADAPPIQRIRLTSPGGVEAEGVTARPNRVIPRSTFDSRLVDAAVGRGAELRRMRVRSLAQTSSHVVVNGRVRASVVIGADGANSSVRRLLGVRANPPEQTAIALRGYAAWPERVPRQEIVMVGDRWPAYGWVFPSGTGIANIGFGLLRSRLHGGRSELRRGLAALVPELATDESTLRAHLLPLSSWRPAAAHGRVLLAGDALSLVNPLTGEGIYYAIASGRAAGAAATSSDPAGRYVATLQHRLGRHLRHTTWLARVARSQRFVDAALEAAAQSRPVFHQLVELGLGRGVISPSLLAGVTARYASRRVCGTGRGAGA